MSEKMREILFRGKSRRTEEWLFGDYEHFYVGTDLHVCIDDCGKNLEEVEPETVGQFTGLTDKNGKKVFEGDIILWCGIKGIVVWEGHKFVIKGNVLWDFSDDDCIEIVGNIHDNPKLLKEEPNV